VHAKARARRHRNPPHCQAECHGRCCPGSESPGRSLPHLGRMLSRAVPGPGHKLSGPPPLELVLTRASGPLCQCPARVWRIYLYTPGHVSLPRMRGVALLSACRFRSSRLRVTRTRIHILIRAPLNGSHQPACTPWRPCLRPHYLTRPLLLATDWSAAAYAALVLAETTQLRGPGVHAARLQASSESLWARAS